MAIDFNKFDKMVDQKELKNQMDAAPEFDDVPKGVYVTSIKAMEVKPTKNQDKLMLSVQMQIVETINAPKKQDKRYVFWNRVICGNKNTDKWNDGVAIKGVISWLEKLLDEGDTIEFKNYSQFAEDVLRLLSSLFAKR